MDEDTGELVTDASRIKPLIHKYISKRTAADTPQGTSQTLAAQNPEPFPFSMPDAVDKFTLECTPPNIHSLAHIISSDHTFELCIRSLAIGKCPGPDGVANEILKALPSSGKQTLQNMFKLMWATGCTPNPWKHSTTVLIYKHKGQPTHLKRYRRIGLELTLYKLWTKMVTIAMTHYGETNAVHSHSQAAFRNKRSTCEQCENLAVTLEDAKGKQDIYLLQIDFSEAFDTVDHNKLIQVLLALGYPQDAIRVVQNLYTNATTAVLTPYGLTDHIPIHRGTIQGDGLSPLLFIIYLEPLLRWLRVGARGYQYSAFTDIADKIRHQAPDCTFADDLNIMTNSHSDLAIQADKVSAYSQWARLQANMDKTTATAALHKSNPQNPYDMTLISKRITSIVRIGGTRVIVQDPKAPFRYLGILYTMDLNSHQCKHIQDLTRRKLQHLKQSWLSRAQKLRTIATSIRPMITYSFPVAPYNDQNIKALDSLVTAAWKQAYGLTVSTATAFMHEDKDKGGLGCPSLQVEYRATLAERLIRTLNDSTTTGHISRALFQRQLDLANKAENAAQRIHTQQSSLHLRQLQALQSLNRTTGLQLMKDGCEYSIDTKENISKSLVAGLLNAHLALDICTNHPGILADILLLAEMGISTLQHLVDSATGLCSTASSLTKLCQRQGSTKHRKAVNRVTTLLHMLGPTKVDPAMYSKAIKGLAAADLPAANRKVSHFVRQRTLQCSTPTYPIQQALCKHNLTRQGHMTLELDLTRKLPHGQRDHSKKKANIRVTETMDPTAESATLKQRSKPHMTGWDLYQLIPSPTMVASYGASDKHAKERWGLYNAYAAPEGTVITDLLALQSAKEKSTDTKQAQVLVQWAGAVMPYWTIQLAEQLGYHPANLQAATHDEIMYNGADTGCEYCVLCRHCKEETDLPTCDACCRSYHMGCLQETELERWQ